MSTKIFDVYITDKPVYDVFQMLGELHVKYKGKTYNKVIDSWLVSNDPLEVSVVVIPLSKRRTIVKVFYSELEDSDCAQELKQLLNTEFSDYHYQNSTDKPDEIPAQEWNARQMNWNRVSDKYGWAYSDMGMVYSIWKPSEYTKKVRNP